MSKEIIRKEIDQIMETIAEQWEIIKSYEGKIPLIEVDLFMGNIRKLYDDLYLLDKMNKAPGFDPERIKSQITRETSIVCETGMKSNPAASEIKEEPAVPVQPENESSSLVQHEPEILIQNQPEFLSETEIMEETAAVSISESGPKFEVVDDRIEETMEETTFEQGQPTFELKTYEAEPEPVQQPVEQPVLRKPQLTPVPDLFGSHPPTLADKYLAEKKSVKDQLATNGNDNSLGNRMQQSQISDLKTAIGINDKFLFINELFKGDLAGYNRAIENLNACQSREEALAKLDEMCEKFKWADHSTSYSRLNEFLKRRYTV